jgi:hypothetical protein
LIVRIIFAARSSRANLSGKSDFDARKFHGWQRARFTAGICACLPSRTPFGSIVSVPKKQKP